MTNRDWRIVAATILTLIPVYLITMAHIFPLDCQEVPLWKEVLIGWPIGLYFGATLTFTTTCAWEWALREKE